MCCGSWKQPHFPSGSLIPYPPPLPAGEFSASDSSLTDIQETRRPMPDPGLMPLPDTAADLDWSNLVDAAKAYEGEFGKIHTERPRTLRGPTLEHVEVGSSLSGSTSPAQLAARRCSLRLFLGHGEVDLTHIGAEGRGLLLSLGQKDHMSRGEGLRSLHAGRIAERITTSAGMLGLLFRL